MLPSTGEMIFMDITKNATNNQYLCEYGYVSNMVMHTCKNSVTRNMEHITK